MSEYRHPLVARDVDVVLGAFRLQIAELSLRTGLTLLVGPNGAGKTTLLRLLSGERFRGSATVLVRGVDIRDYGYRLTSEVQLVRDSLNSVEGLDVRRLVLLAQAAHGVRWSVTRAESLMQRLQLTRERQLRHLSRGNAAKLGLVIAEAASPSVLLLDEPTSGLDPFARAAFLDVLAELVHERPDRAVLLSTHLLEDAALDAPVSMIVLGDGRVRRVLSPMEVQAFRSSSIEQRRAAMIEWYPVFASQELS